jgi:hypothetical protein
MCINLILFFSCSIGFGLGLGLGLGLVLASGTPASASAPRKKSARQRDYPLSVAGTFALVRRWLEIPTPISSLSMAHMTQRPPDSSGLCIVILLKHRARAVLRWNVTACHRAEYRRLVCHRFAICASIYCYIASLSNGVVSNIKRSNHPRCRLLNTIRADRWMIGVSSKEEKKREECENF